MLTLSEIEKEVNRLAAKIGEAERYLPTYGQSKDFGRPHIEANVSGYHYVVVERGNELKRITTDDLNELLYNIFKAITFSLACDYELANRIENQDCRRLIFKRQVELLSKLSKDWSFRESQQHEQILREHPFDDLASARANLSKQIGWQAACEKFPLPK
jgi:type II restriction/modification system DNA methylase subunit YeeA